MVFRCLVASIDHQQHAVRSPLARAKKIEYGGAVSILPTILVLSFAFCPSVQISFMKSVPLLVYAPVKCMYK